MKITHSQKESIIKDVWINGTLEAATTKDITIETIHEEMKKSAIFKRRIRNALEEAKGMLIDEARALVRDYMRGAKYMKTDRNRLTAAIALLNAYEPGFKGTTTISGKVDHNIRVITGVPRPTYKELPPPKITIQRNKKYLNISDQDKDKLKEINTSKPVTSRSKRKPI